MSGAVRGASPKASTGGASRRRQPPPPPPSGDEGRAPIVERHRGVEVVFYPGPLPRLGDEPLTPAELEFRWLIAGELVPDRSGGERVEVRPEFHDWSERVRLAWEAENIVWCHGYADGKPVWRRERPPPDVEPPRATSKSGKSNEPPRCKLRTKTQEEGSHP